MSGRITLVGAGPGDPELITLRGLRALEEADAVVFDRLAPPELLARARPGARLIDAGKRPGAQAMSQERISALIAELAAAGKRVVRLKGGDPLIFGRGGEELAAAARRGVPCEVVPGVTAAAGAAAYCAMPLTARGRSRTVTLVSGREASGPDDARVDWGTLARTGGTIAVYMGLERLPEIAGALMAGGLPAGTAAAVVSRATTPEQEALVSTLGRVAADVRRAGLGPPALLLVGRTAAIRRGPSWFERLPLFGRRVLVTRERERAAGLVDGLRRLGAGVWELPTIAVAPTRSPAALDAALRRIERYRWVVFASANAVGTVHRRLFRLGRDLRSLAGVSLAAAGPGTAAALAAAGLRADLVAEDSGARGLLRALSRADIRGERVLLPRSGCGLEALPEGLARLGARVDAVEAYRLVRPAVDAAGRAALGALARREVDLAVFTSPSTARNLAAMLGPARLVRLRGMRAAAIGPTTARAARELGFRVVAVPRRQELGEFVRTIAARLGSGGNWPRRSGRGWRR